MGCGSILIIISAADSRKLNKIRAAVRIADRLVENICPGASHPERKLAELPDREQKPGRNTKFPCSSTLRVIAGLKVGLGLELECI